MNKIYVVTEGSYSDYSIDKIFSTKELAENYHKEMTLTGYDLNSIEEYSLDDWDQTLKAEQFFVSTINIENGTIEQDKTYFGYPRECRHGLRKPGERVYYIKGISNSYYLDFNLCKCMDYKEHYKNVAISVASFVSQEHANKVAVEKRQEFLRTGVISEDL